MRDLRGAQVDAIVPPAARWAGRTVYRKRRERGGTSTRAVVHSTSKGVLVDRLRRDPCYRKTYLQAFPSQTFFQPWLASAESASYQASVGPKTWTSRSLPPFAFQFR